MSIFLSSAGPGGLSELPTGASAYHTTATPGATRGPLEGGNGRLEIFPGRRSPRAHTLTARSLRIRQREGLTTLPENESGGDILLGEGTGGGNSRSPSNGREFVDLKQPAGAGASRRGLKSSPNLASTEYHH
jgi:hypothetical protein